MAKKIHNNMAQKRQISNGVNQEAYHNLISGRRKGAGAAALRLLLKAAAGIYRLIICLRNILYDSGILRIHSVGVPVISVGNITTGGTGKTPLVIWLCKFSEQKNISCAILTRGYKTIEKSMDEPAILAESCPDAKVVVNPNRIAGATEAIDKLDANVLIMDDGFQHRRLGRDIDIVTIDATCPFGYGRMLPAGLLREPAGALKRADAVVVTRVEQISKGQLIEIEEKIKSINPNIIIAKSIHTPTCVRSVNSEDFGTEELEGKKIFAFCGLGNPESFLSTISQLGADLVGSKIYDDHHCYTDKDIGEIYDNARDLKAELILTTRKDRTKIPDCQSAVPGIPLAYLEIELRFTEGEDKLKELIEKALAGKI